MYHYEDLLKAEQKDLECNLVSLLELSAGVFVQSGPQREKQAMLLVLPFESFFHYLMFLIPTLSPSLYSIQFSLLIIRFLIA